MIAGRFSQPQTHSGYPGPAFAVARPCGRSRQRRRRASRL